MKKRLHDKKAGIAILTALILITLGEMIFRAIALGKAVLSTANVGEQVAVIVLAAIVLILTAKGNDRACYILYGAWIGYFVLDQLFELPGHLSQLASTLLHADGITVIHIGLIVHALSYIGIIAIGVLLVEYMTDGSIYNRAFNLVCIATVALLLASTGISIYNAAMGSPLDLLLLTFNNLYRITMVFLCTFFAYDSAKMQLKKADLKK